VQGGRGSGRRDAPTLDFIPCPRDFPLDVANATCYYAAIQVEHPAMTDLTPRNDNNPDVAVARLQADFVGRLALRDATMLLTRGAYARPQRSLARSAPATQRASGGAARPSPLTPARAYA